MRRIEAETLGEARERIKLLGYRQMGGAPGVGSPVVWFDHDLKMLRQVVLKDLRDDGRWEVETLDQHIGEFGTFPAEVRIFAKVEDLYLGPEPVEPDDIEDGCCNCGWPHDEHLAGKGRKGCDHWMEPTTANRLKALARGFKDETKELILAGAEAASLTGCGDSPRRNVVLNQAVRLIEQVAAMDRVERSSHSGTKHIRVTQARSTYGYTVVLEAPDLVLDLGVLFDVQWSHAQELGDFLEGFIDRLPTKVRPPEENLLALPAEIRADAVRLAALEGDEAVTAIESALLLWSNRESAQSVRDEVVGLMIRREPDVELEVCESCHERSEFDRESASFPPILHKASCRVAHQLSRWGFEVAYIECIGEHHRWEQGEISTLSCRICGAEAEPCEECEQTGKGRDDDGELTGESCFLCGGKGFYLARIE